MTALGNESLPLSSYFPSLLRIFGFEFYFYYLASMFNVQTLIRLGNKTKIGKSIPVHCVVMNTTTPCYLADAAMISTPSASGGIEGGATTPTKATCNSGHQAEESVDVDSYAIIPASTLFNQIVPVVLRKLGYTEDVIFNATGLHFLFCFVLPMHHNAPALIETFCVQQVG